MADPIRGAINHIRILIEAINDGRVEAKTVKEMTDEQLVGYIGRLKDEARSEVDEGYQLHENDTPPEE